MEFRSMFKSIFGQQKAEPQTVRLELLNDYQQVFFTRNDYSNDILLKTCFATLAKHIAKLEPTITKFENGKRTPNKEFQVLQSCLTLTPNPYITSYDFYYRLAYNLIQNQNAFVKINRDKFNNVISLWNLDYLSIEPRELDNEIYLKFTFKNGNKETIP